MRLGVEVHAVERADRRDAAASRKGMPFSLATTA
jgi:hypothetical protein